MWPSIPVMTHSLDQEVMARKAKARKCTAEIAGNVQAKVERQHRLLISFSVIPPSRSIPQRHTKMCVISPHNSAGMVIIMWCQTVKFSPAPNNTFAQSELKLFYIDSFSRSCGIVGWSDMFRKSDLHKLWRWYCELWWEDDEGNHLRVHWVVHFWRGISKWGNPCFSNTHTPKFECVVNYLSWVARTSLSS